ncbi:MAG: hypothetical protein GTO02_15360 [Candidatus Dadabacteria bacterium]|nr:hypothetical protein [Candidatus Dadabacteria bacterium]
MTNNENLVKKLLAKLNEIYPLGLYEYIYDNNKTLQDELKNCEDEINNMLENGTMNDTKKILRNYWILHIEAIDFYKKHKRKKIKY